ncbi:major facilitator superfamily transporter multidrug resistance [Xylariales sp. AK1849]|nr:major facilitator superfamily transporter multidrug resistance [Xylariales sp. AK1849]
MSEKEEKGEHSRPPTGSSTARDDDARRQSQQGSEAGDASDVDHEDIERIVPGHELDMELQSARRVETRTSVKSRASRVMSIVSRRSRTNREGLRHELLPLTNLDEGTVGWASQDDPEMPLNFPAWKKWMLVGLLAAITLLTPFASSILSPAIAKVDQEFGNDNQIVGSMTVSIYLLGYVIGPLFMAPLSEIYGRKLVLGAANVFFCVWQIGCALAPSIETLIVFRFFSGVGGAGCLTLGGGVIGDLFRADQRGFAIGIWTLGPLLGPTIGPLIGGFLVETIGWRWDFWIILIVAVIVTVLIEVFNKETSHRVLIKRKTVRLRKELGRDDLRSCYDKSGHQSKARVLSDGLIRPLKMMFLSPLVFFLSLYIAFVYGVLYLLFTTIPTVFEATYNFNVSSTGLVYLALGLGNILGWLFVTLYSDKSVIRLARANDGVFEPEMRLTISIYFGIFLPITLFWYGWTTYYKTHWISPVLSLIPYGFGIMGIFLPITTYLVDSYPMYAASAIAANTVLRSLVGALLPLAGQPMYESLGLGWGNSLLGFICVGMIPLPVIFYKFGARLRKAQRFTL